MSGNQALRQLESHKLLPIIAGIYTSQSILSAMIFMALPSVLRDAGVGLDNISYLYLLMLPWALKVFWSPFIERYRMGENGQRRSRQIILFGQGLLLLALFIASFLLPTVSLLCLLITLAVATFIVATVDIACDGFAIEQLKLRQRSWGNVMQVGGSYIGLMLGAGMFLIILDRTSWQVSVWLIMFVVILLTAPVFFMKAQTQRIQRHNNRPSLLKALRRPEVINGLLITILFQCGLRIVLSTLSPFLIDQGYSLTLVGLISGVAGTIASLGGVIMAGLVINRIGVNRMLKTLVVTQCILFICFYCVSLSPHTLKIGLIILLIANAMVIGASFVTLYTAMMNWSSKSQAGVDFTLFQSVDATLLVLLGFIANQISHYLGYTATFAISVFMVVLAFIAISYLLALKNNKSVGNISL